MGLRFHAGPCPSTCLAPKNRYSISMLLQAIKRPFSYRIGKELRLTGHPLLNVLAARERSGKRVFRFWQPGGGYDRNLIGAESLRKAMEYLHNNPVRKGLVSSPAEWLWSSSCRYDESGEQALLSVDEGLEL